MLDVQTRDKPGPVDQIILDLWAATNHAFRPIPYGFRQFNNIQYNGGHIIKLYIADTETFASTPINRWENTYYLGADKKYELYFNRRNDKLIQFTVPADDVAMLSYFQQLLQDAIGTDAIKDSCMRFNLPLSQQLPYWINKYSFDVHTGRAYWAVQTEFSKYCNLVFFNTPGNVWNYQARYEVHVDTNAFNWLSKQFFYIHESTNTEHFHRNVELDRRVSLLSAKEKIYFNGKSLQFELDRLAKLAAKDKEKI